MAFKFPFTNYHELNLTWVLEQLKKLFEDSEENVETIESYENRLSAVETELPTVEATANQAETVANAAATLAQTAKTTADTANENALTASAQAGLARQEAATADAEAQAATQAAQQVQAIVQDFDGRITQAEDDASEALQEAQSFENRVNAAINTANNAANTATIAQGIAVNANQNAATALDTAQTADGKAEAAQDAADIADGKAEAAQDAADIADGKAEAAQDTADLADEKADTNAANIGNLANLTTTAKNNLVAAINEAAQTGGGGDITSCAPVIINTASGDVASFSDGANNRPIQNIIGSIIKSSIRAVFGNGGNNLCNTSLLTPYGTLRQFVYYPSSNSYYVSTQNTYTGVYVPVRVVAGKTYTFSIKYAGTSDPTTKMIALVNTGGTDRKTTSESSSSGTGYLQTTYTAVATEILYFRIYLRRGTSNNFYGTVSEIKVEEGSQRTSDTTTFLVADFIDPETSESVTFTQGAVTLNADGSLDVVSTAGDDVTLHIDNVGHLYTQKGDNNVWISTGAITECNYPADTKLYIDEKVTELQALILEN